MISCIIVEDEHLARQKLQLYVNDHKDLDLIASYASGEDFLKIANTLDYELLLLDIGLPNIDGITLAATLPEYCKVIFTTAFDNYAVEAFNINAVDYLLKPFDFERFSKAIEKVNSVTDQVKNAIPEKSKIFVKEGRKIHRLHIDDILYIKGLKEYVVWYTAQGQLVTLHSLAHLSDYLKPYGFIQTHKSYIVNRQKVRVMEYRFVHLGQEQIPIGRSYRAKVKKSFEADLK